jgi:hypothetical protein
LRTQFSTTDADARLLSKAGQTIAGYNVQIAIDDKHKLTKFCCRGHTQPVPTCKRCGERGRFDGYLLRPNLRQQT